MFATKAARTTLTATIAAMLMFIGFVTLPVVTATPTHDAVAHTNTKSVT
jgi:hypothetical protein